MLKKLFGKTSSADLSAQLEKARAELIAAEAAVETAEQQYQSGLLTETATALRKLVDAKAEASISADIARARIAKLESDLVDARAAEAEAGREEAYDRAQTLVDAARKKLAVYDKAARQIRDVLRDLAEAELEVQSVNDALPDGKPPLAGPESERSVPALWREVLSETTVELWSGAGDSSPISDDLQRKVQPYEVRRSRSRYDDPAEDEAPQTGVVRVDGGSSLEVVLRKFIRREVLPDQSGWSAASLASAIALPALHAGATDYWTPTTGRPGDVLANLAKPLLPRPERPERKPVYEYRLAPKERTIAED